MAKIGLKTSVVKAVAGMSTKIAYGDIESTCVGWIYQPKRPEALKKRLKKS